MKNQTTVIAVIIIAAIAFFLYNQSSAPGTYDDFAKCLTANDVKMYGAFWCPHCQNQKKSFGASWQYVDYIECSMPDGNSQTEFCKQANIQSYPVWEFKDGSRVEGEATFAVLSQKSGCSLQ
jgi:hypothetical protein